MDRQNNLISWLLNDAPDAIRLLTTRVSTINFTAIHTSSNVYYHCKIPKTLYWIISWSGASLVLCFLAGNTQYIQPLREEVESIVKNGWLKAYLRKMRRIDSFLMGSQHVSCERLR
ncbi:hypothetical protein JVU11DRAFT_9764 [Chiua virens]|nr:hypothetical protein JVU11DRAFT_9764 [Chiua virens]